LDRGVNLERKLEDSAAKERQRLDEQIQEMEAKLTEDMTTKAEKESVSLRKKIGDLERQLDAAKSKELICDLAMKVMETPDKTSKF